jgi:hypothetical protein
MRNGGEVLQIFNFSNKIEWLDYRSGFFLLNKNAIGTNLVAA